jgi:hypothetical protein
VTAFVHHLAITVLVATLAAVGVRWLLPTLFRTGLGLLQDTLLGFGALLLLPEYWVSSAYRTRAGRPPHLAYEYGSAVAGVCRVLHSALCRVMRSLAIAAGAVPLPIIGAIAGGIYLASLTR